MTFKEFFTKSLEENAGNVARMAKALDLSPSTVRAYMSRYDLTHSALSLTLDFSMVQELLETNGGDTAVTAKMLNLSQNGLIRYLKREARSEGLRLAVSAGQHVAAVKPALEAMSLAV